MMALVGLPSLDRTLVGQSAAIFLMVVSGGCKNEPGALELIIKCDKAMVAKYEPIPLECTLVCKNGPLCLRKGYYYAVTLEPLDGEAKPMMSGKIARCGGTAMALLPVYPFVAAGALLDVADGSGRYEVLKTGEEKTTRWCVRRSEFGGIWMASQELCSEGGTPFWRPGQYRVVAQLLNEHSTDTFWLPPLFWTPYSQPVDAQAVVTIASTDPAPSSQPDADSKRAKTR